MKLPRERLKRSRLFRFAARRLIRALRPYVRLEHAPGRRALWHGLVWRLMWTEGMCRARTREGARLEVDASDLVGTYIAYFGVWEPNLTSWLEGRLRPGDVFVDVGANVGYFTVLASRLVGESGRVVAIEPSPLANSVLRRNVSDNGGENVRVENVAVWDSSGEVVVFGASQRIVGGTTLDPAWAARWSLDTQVPSPPSRLRRCFRTTRSPAPQCSRSTSKDPSSRCSKEWSRSFRGFEMTRRSSSSSRAMPCGSRPRPSGASDSKPS
jgi:Protein-L-isoaspartate(D-aspartate) O-methyltransferase (PCMT)